jgi:hypothetical protein
MGSAEPPVYLEGGRGTLRAVDAAAKKAEARHEDLVRSAELPVLSLDHGCVRPRSRSPRDVDPRRCPPGGPTGGLTPPRSRAGVPPGRSLQLLSRSRRQVGARGARLALSVRRCSDATTGLSRARCRSRCSGLCCHGSSFHPRLGPPGEPVGVILAAEAPLRGIFVSIWARLRCSAAVCETGFGEAVKPAVQDRHPVAAKLAA